MQSQNEYIGDDKFIKMLEHYQCPAPLSLVKMRFAGAICTPNLELRPTDVIASLWPEGQSPRLQTKEEAELFFKFFMGLWDEIFKHVIDNKIELSKYKIKNEADIITTCKQRVADIENGFLEGFWGGCENIQIPAYIAQILDSLSELAEVYGQVCSQNINDKNFDMAVKTINNTDKMVNRSINFIIENYVLPHFDKARNKN